MNYREWQKACKEGCAPRKYDNLCRAEQKSLKYNPDPKATVRHHLRDTEEQRKYNDEHYEMWGFNLDGTFEYGKYVIFVTKEEHTNIHSHSEDTRRKISESNKANYTNERRQRVSECMKKRYIENPERHPTKGKHHSDATKSKISESHKSENMSDEYRKNLSEGVKRSMTKERRKQISERNKNRSEEERLNLSNAAKKRWQSEEYRANQEKSRFIWTEEKRKEFGETRKGNNNPMYGKHPSSETVNKRAESCKNTWTEEKREDYKRVKQEIYKNVSESYREYKLAGGELKWNDFLKIYFSSSKSEE